MNVSADMPRVCGMNGARYCVQSVRMWVNLSSPARIGATVKPKWRMRYA